MEIERLEILAYSESGFEPRQERIVIEAPLDIALNGVVKNHALRLPGMDAELAVGWCYSQGLIGSGAAVQEIRPRAESAIDIATAGESETPSRKPSQPLDPKEGPRFTPRFLFDLQKDFFTHQRIFSQTGATHAAGLYDGNGSLLIFAEDVGRHNALDKCIGHLLLTDRLREAAFGLLSSRLSLEMAAKACRARIPVLAGVSAPTSLAVQLARQQGMTLVGFLRPPRFNLYAGEQRLIRE
ncbi:MAG: formate dehydrogenase accessory sulfurtransferase FdhD [Deltaproteobacteria bacterium]|nr:formate dehydrogenase accessory sulfurtransferase FdhD [Deltaproteobacteria bacterium]